MVAFFVFIFYILLQEKQTDDKLKDIHYQKEQEELAMLKTRHALLKSSYLHPKGTNADSFYAAIDMEKNTTIE